jgi:hypothetical protein
LTYRFLNLAAGCNTATHESHQQNQKIGSSAEIVHDGGVSDRQAADALEFLTTKYTKYTKKGGERRGGLEGFAASWNF